MNPRALPLLAPLLAACAPPAPDPVAIDHCVLKEYLEDCETELATPEEQAACRRKASQESIRILAGIPAECRAPSNVGAP
jgi:hypothetical protein